MSQVSRGTKSAGGTSFTAHSNALSAEVNTDFQNLVDAHNQHDDGTLTWQRVKVTNATNPPLIANNSTGSNDIAQFQANGTTKVNVTGTGDLNLASGVDILGGRFAAYRRPTLQWSSISAVNLEVGLTGTAGQAAVLFPDGDYRTDSTATRINFDITRNAVLSGSAQSGLRTSLSEAANTWYSLYAVKVSDSATNFVLVGDTLTPTQANFASLNSNFGTNSWVYLGCIPNGDGAAATTDIPKFVQNGNEITFYNIETSSVPGIRLANTAGATSLTWTYASGTALGSAQVPSHITTGSYIGRQGTSTAIVVSDSAVAILILSATWASASHIYPVPNQALAAGLKINPGTSVAIEILLQSFKDSVLGGGASAVL